MQLETLEGRQHGRRSLSYQIFKAGNGFAIRFPDLETLTITTLGLSD